MMNNSTAAQRLRVHSHLKKFKKLTTLQARSELDVMHPAARVQELRGSGLNIETHWREDTTSEGNPHRVAEYILMPGKRKTPAATGAKKGHSNDAGVHRER